MVANAVDCISGWDSNGEGGGDGDEDGEVDGVSEGEVDGVVEDGWGSVNALGTYQKYYIFEKQFRIMHR